MLTAKFHHQLLPFQSFYVALVIVTAFFSSVSARSLYDTQKNRENQEAGFRAALEPTAQVHRIGSFEFTIPDDGTLGSGFISYGFDPVTGEPLPSFQFPQDSNLDYLFGGALWIGALAGEDTLVSMANDGWAFFDGMIPSPIEPGVRIVSGFADENFETTYNDSLPPIWNTVNKPGALGITVRQRSLAWNQEPNNDFAVIEYHITNSFNADTLKELYVGLYLDADVRYLPETNGSIDDIAGFLPEKGIAYIADNDGQPVNSSDTVWTEKSTRAVLGAKILDVKYSGAEPLNPPSFNWWSSNGDVSRDFGPRRSGTAGDPFREFEDGALGTPVGSNDKYYILSHPEQDYNQIEMALDHSGDGWLPPIDSGLAVNLAGGMDSRFLISQGGISLAPGDSMVFVVVIAIGDGFHVNPTDYADSFDPLNPDVFRNKLNFTDLEQNIQAAESLYASGYILPITSPPPRPTLDDKLSAEPLMSWIFSANPSVEGYDVYLAKAADSSVLCHYALIDTPLFIPENKIATVATDTFRLTGLEDGAWYAAAVAVHPLPDSATPISEPVVFQYGVPHAPTWDSAMFLNEDQLKYQYVSAGPAAPLRWKTQDSDIDHFNVYRLADSIGDFSSLNQLGIGNCFVFPAAGVEVICTGMTRDSALVCLTSKLPSAQVPGELLAFADTPEIPSKNRYGITAVDSAGSESAMSIRILGYTYQIDRKPLLFTMVDSIRTGGPNLGRTKDVFHYYRDLLAPYNPDYRFRTKLRGQKLRWPPKYEEVAQYRVLAVDGSSRTGLILSWQRIQHGRPDWLLDYARSGGTIVDVGINFASTRSSASPPQLVRTIYLPSGQSFYNSGREIFGLDSAIMVPPQTGDSVRDSVNQFYRPFGALATAGSGFPDLSYHHSGFYTQPVELTEGPIPFKGVIFPQAENTEVLYTWVSGRDTASDFAGLPIGLKYTPVTHTAYVLISCPWEWEPEQAQAFFAKLLGDFQTDITDDETPTLPKVFALSQNFPNPFNPTTQISYSVPHRSQVTLVVYNILGQKVGTLVNEIKEAGEHVVTWDASAYASGMYFYRLQAAGVKLSKKMVLLK